MTKRNKIIYWVATIWLSLGMTSTGIVQIIKMDEEAANFSNLGYPAYLMTIIGTWKILGVIAVLFPSGQKTFINLIREWAYAGFFFTMTGAIISHMIIDDPAIASFGPTLLLVLTVISWYFRPDKRKLVSIK